MAGRSSGIWENHSGLLEHWSTAVVKLPRDSPNQPLKCYTVITQILSLIWMAFELAVWSLFEAHTGRTITDLWTMTCYSYLRSQGTTFCYYSVFLSCPAISPWDFPWNFLVSRTFHVLKKLTEKKNNPTIKLKLHNCFVYFIQKIIPWRIVF